jgi:hypothetical protein
MLKLRGSSIRLWLSTVYYQKGVEEMDPPVVAQNPNRSGTPLDSQRTRLSATLKDNLDRVVQSNSRLAVPDREVLHVGACLTTLASVTTEEELHGIFLESVNPE